MSTWHAAPADGGVAIALRVARARDTGVAIVPTGAAGVTLWMSELDVPLPHAGRSLIGADLLDLSGPGEDLGQLLERAALMNARQAHARAELELGQGPRRG